MYIHKYSANDMSIYLVSSKPSKPSENMVLTAQNWKGYSSGSAVKNAVDFLHELSFSKEDKAEPKDDKKKKAALRVLRGFTQQGAILDEISFSRVEE
jgi:hypothetical protein